MSFGHERLDVYNLSVEYVTWVLEESSALKGDNRSIKDQWLRASQSIPLNIAEGNGKGSKADRRRFFEIARGSVMECAAVQDILCALKFLTTEQNLETKKQLDRIAAMLSKLGGRSYEQ